MVTRGNTGRFFHSHTGDQPSMLDSSSEAFSGKPSQQNLNLLSHRKNLWGSESANAQAYSRQSKNQAENQDEEQEDSDDSNGSGNGNTDDDQEDNDQDSDDDNADSPSSQATETWKSVWNARKYSGETDSASGSRPQKASRAKVPLRERLWQKN